MSDLISQGQNKVWLSNFQPMIKKSLPQIKLTNPADLKIGKRAEGDSGWLEMRNRG